MFITKTSLSRRAVLRGMGATLALPLLDAMVPALTAQSKTAANSPMRFGAIYLPNGVWPEAWHPDQAGKNFEFKPVMKPLEPFRDQLVTVKIVMPAELIRSGDVRLWQHRNFGKALVRHLIEHYTRRGIRELTVNTQDTNAASLTVYRGLGFVPMGASFPVYQLSLAGAGRG